MLQGAVQGPLALHREREVAGSGAGWVELHGAQQGGRGRCGCGPVAGPGGEPPGQLQRAQPLLFVVLAGLVVEGSRPFGDVVGGR